MKNEIWPLNFAAFNRLLGLIRERSGKLVGESINYGYTEKLKIEIGLKEKLYPGGIINHFDLI